MAVVRIEDPEGERFPLPEVCVRCGAAATTWKDRKFTWHPPWVWILLLLGVLPFVIVALILTKRMRFRVPLCDSHRYHWGGRTLIVLGAFAGLILLEIVSKEAPKAVRDVWSPVFFFLIFCWVVLAVVLSATTVRPAEITDYTITLKGVSPEFADAVRDERRLAWDIEDETERYWRDRRNRAPREDSERERYRRPEEGIEGD
jgi:hypothetical protein